jgi:protein TonB
MSETNRLLEDGESRQTADSVANEENPNETADQQLLTVDSKPQTANGQPPTSNRKPLTANRPPLTANSTMDPSDDEELSFYRRYRFFIWAGGLIILIAPITLAIRTLTANQPPAKVQPVTFVKLLPPVPTPTPPPPQQSTPRPQEMVEQKQMMEPETKPVHPDEKPKEENKKQAPPGPLGVNAKGEGQGDAFGLVGRPGGNGLLNGGGGGSGSRFGWYASQVQSRIEQALRDNGHTRGASIPGLRVRIWADNTGRVTRAQLIGSTGNAAIDSAITNEVLTGLQLQEPPPSDMPMPIVLRVTAHRSS